MADYLPPVVAKLQGDISDFLAKMAAAKAAMDDLKSSGGEVHLGSVVNDPASSGASDGETYGQNYEKEVDNTEEPIEKQRRQRRKKESEDGGKEDGDAFAAAFQKILDDSDKLSLKSSQLFTKTQAVQDRARKLGDLAGNEIAKGVDETVDDALKDTVLGEDSFSGQGEKDGDAFAREFQKVLDDSDKLSLQNSALFASTEGVRARAERIGSEAGRSLGKSADDEISAAMKAVEKKTVEDMTKAGNDSGKGFGSALTGAIKPFSLTSLITGGVGMAGGLVSALGVGGTGALAAGMSALVTEYGLKLAETNAAFKKKFTAVETDFKNQMGQALMPTVLDLGNQVMGLLKGIEPAAISGMKNLMGGASELLRNATPALIQFVDSFSRLTPIIANVAGAFGSDLGPVLRGVSTLFTDLFTTVDNMGPQMATTMRGLGTLIGNLGSGISTIISGAENLIGPTFSALNQLVLTLLQTLGELFQDATPGLTKLIGVLGSGLSSALADIEPALGALVSSLGSGLASVLAGLLPALSSIINALANALAPVLPVIGSALGALLPPVGQLIAALVQLAGGFLGALMPAIEPALTALVKFGTELAQLLIPIIAQMAPIFSETAIFIGQTLNAVLPLIPSILNLVKACLPLIPAMIKINSAFAQVMIAMMPFIGIVMKIVAVVLDLVAIIGVPLVQAFAKGAQWASELVSWFAKLASEGAQKSAIVGQAFSWLEGILNGVFNHMKGYIQTAITTVAGWASDVGNDATKVINWFKKLPGEIGNALGSLWNILFGIGKHAMQGLINGISSMVGSVLGSIGHIASSIGGAFTSILGIHSPSRVFYEHGRNIVLGLVEGIQQNARLATQAIGDLASGSATAFNSSNARMVASPTYAGTGNGNVQVTINVPQGIVASEQQLAQIIQQVMLRNGMQNRASYPTYQSSRGRR